MDCKSVFDGTNRYIIGWNPSNGKNQDFGGAQWGGNIVAHKIIQAQDGRLYVDIPDAIKDAYCVPESIRVDKQNGMIEQMDNGWKLNGTYQYGDLDFGRLPRECRISFDVTFDTGADMFYVMLNCDEQHENGYFIGFDVAVGRIVFDRWPRRHDNYPFMIEMERIIQVEAGRTYHVDMIKDNSVLEVYFDHKYAMSARTYDYQAGNWGVVITRGTVRLEEIGLWIENKTRN